ncbi:helix-turn-helix domain-containing protein [Anaeromassilibacillus senegalensis]|uniref:helix-turn-helix domain-containing protein n=1 Tax=Anaeromassilibacillus senegalensis TaxID=1673717 RepID=UPI00067FB50C|nr:helix-turn-helix transcriptional regulator [Anaeromassilibacillus senegalensis]
MYKRIRELREDNDLGQKELADYLQVHQTTYSDYELGNLNIPNAALVKLAEYYGTSTDYLLELTDDPRPYKRSENFSKTKNKQ